MQLGNYDPMLLTETNIPYDAYFHNRLGYDIVCSQVVGTAARAVYGGVGLVMRERPDGWSFDSMRFHGPNMVSFDFFWKTA